MREAASDADARGAQARDILDGLTAAAADQEHNKDLVTAIRDADDARQRWLERWQQRSQTQAAHTSGPAISVLPRVPPAVPNAHLEITGPGDWSALRRRIEALLGEYPGHSFEVLIEVRDDAQPVDDAAR